MKKILIILMPFDHGLSGISVYIREMAKEMVRQVDKDTLIDFYCLDRDLRFFPEKQENTNYIIFPNFFYRPIPNMLLHLFYFPLKLWLKKLFQGKKEQYDAVLLPAGNRRIFFFYPFYTVAVVHDLAPLRLPKKYDAFRTFYVKRVIPFFLKRADRVIAVSRSTLSDVIHLTNLNQEKAGISYPGCKMDHFPSIQTSKNKVAKEIASQWGITKKFFLFVSRIEFPGKNHVGLMKAYEKLPAKIKDNYDLIFAGSPWKDSEKVKNHALAMEENHNIHFLGFVTVEELSWLYRGAEIFIFPSYYEGFGFPVLEAMAHGTPTIMSDRSSLLELGHETSLTFDPSSPDSISATILETLKNKKRQKMMISNGYKKAKEFSWERSVNRLLLYMSKQNLPLVLANKNKKTLSKITHVERHEIFGISFINGTFYKVIELLENAFLMRKKTNFSFLNAHSINLAQKNLDFKNALLESDYVLPDGIGVKIACMLAGFKVEENLNGTDFLPHLLTFLQKKKLSIYFLGSKPGVVERMCRKLAHTHPDLKIAGCHHGYQKNIRAELSIIKNINKTKPDVLLVGMGSPLQELFVSRHKDILQTKIIMSVGGLFNFYSGDIPRAPLAFRKIGLEWAFRLYQEPWRLWRRYLIGNVAFLYRAGVWAFRRKNV